MQQNQCVDKLINHWVFKRSLTYSSSLLHNLLNSQRTNNQTVRRWMLFNESVRWSYRLRVTFARALRYCDVSPEPSRAEYVWRSSGLTRDLKCRRRRAEKAAGEGRDPVGAAAHLWALHPRVRAPQLRACPAARAQNH